MPPRTLSSHVAWSKLMIHESMYRTNLRAMIYGLCQRPMAIEELNFMTYWDLNDKLNDYSYADSKGRLAKVLIFEEIGVLQSPNSYFVKLAIRIGE